MTCSKFLSAATLALGLVLASGTRAAAQTNGSSGGTAVGYANYAMQYAQAADQPRSTHLTNRAYFYAYYAYYYAYYGYYSDLSYFGMTYGMASAAHDYSLDAYNATRNLSSYYAQYYSSLASSNAYSAFFGQ